MKEIASITFSPLLLGGQYRGTQRRFLPKYVQNTFYAIQSSFNFRSLEIYYKRRYTIGICSVVLGDFESFRNFEGFSFISRKF